MEARLCSVGHGLMEKRSGLMDDTRLTRVTGDAERLAALDIVAPLPRQPLQRRRLGGGRVCPP